MEVIQEAIPSERDSWCAICTEQIKEGDMMLVVVDDNHYTQDVHQGCYED